MYKAIVFDFFGVFCPDITMEWFKQAVPDYAAKLPSFQAICTESDYGRLSRENFFKDVSALANVSVDEMTKGVEAQTVIDTTLTNYVSRLRKQNYKIACLSNGTQEWTRRVITDHGLGHLFDTIILSGDLGIIKPNPEIYIRALQNLQVSSKETIFVDDRRANTKAAEKIGIKSIVFTNTTAFISDLENLLASSK